MSVTTKVNFRTFQPPPNYIEKSGFSKEQLFIEDLKNEDNELWLFKTSRDFDSSSLKNKVVSLQEETIFQNDNYLLKDKSHKISVSTAFLNELLDYQLLLPSRSNSELFLVSLPFAGHLNLADIENPHLVFPPQSSEEHKKDISNLKQRYVPFGSDEPLTTISTPKRKYRKKHFSSHSYTDADTPVSEKKKVSFKFPLTATQENNVTLEAENSLQGPILPTTNSLHKLSKQKKLYGNYHFQENTLLQEKSKKKKKGSKQIETTISYSLPSKEEKLLSFDNFLTQSHEMDPCETVGNSKDNSHFMDVQKSQKAAKEKGSPKNDCLQDCTTIHKKSKKRKKTDKTWRSDHAKSDTLCSEEKVSSPNTLLTSCETQDSFMEAKKSRKQIKEKELSENDDSQDDKIKSKRKKLPDKFWKSDHKENNILVTKKRLLSDTLLIQSQGCLSGIDCYQSNIKQMKSKKKRSKSNECKGSKGFIQHNGRDISGQIDDMNAKEIKYSSKTDIKTQAIPSVDGFLKDTAMNDNKNCLKKEKESKKQDHKSVPFQLKSINKESDQNSLTGLNIKETRQDFEAEESLIECNLKPSKKHKTKKRENNNKVAENMLNFGENCNKDDSSTFLQTDGTTTQEDISYFNLNIVKKECQSVPYENVSIKIDAKKNQHDYIESNHVLNDEDNKNNSSLYLQDDDTVIKDNISHSNLNIVKKECQSVCSPRNTSIKKEKKKNRHGYSSCVLNESNKAHYMRLQDNDTVIKDDTHQFDLDIVKKEYHSDHSQESILIKKRRKKRHSHIENNHVLNGNNKDDNSVCFQDSDTVMKNYIPHFDLNIVKKEYHSNHNQEDASFKKRRKKRHSHVENNKDDSSVCFQDGDTVMKNYIPHFDLNIVKKEYHSNHNQEDTSFKKRRKKRHSHVENNKDDSSVCFQDGDTVVKDDILHFNLNVVKKECQSDLSQENASGKKEQKKNQHGHIVGNHILNNKNTKDVASICLNDSDTAVKDDMLHFNLNIVKKEYNLDHSQENTSVKRKKKHDLIVNSHIHSQVNNKDNSVCLQYDNTVIKDNKPCIDLNIIKEECHSVHSQGTTPVKKEKKKKSK